MKTLGSFLVLVGAVALQGCAVQSADEGTVENVDESLITCSTNNGKWPMAAAFAVAIANEIGEIDVVRDFSAPTAQALVLNSSARCYKNGRGCNNILGILALQDPSVNDCSNGRVCLNKEVFNATVFGTGLVAMRGEQITRDAEIKMNYPNKWAELQVGHVLVPDYSDTFSPKPTNNCNGVHFYYNAYQPIYDSAGNVIGKKMLPHPEYLKDRLWAFGGTVNNQYLAFDSVKADPNSTNPAGISKIAIDPDDTGNRTPSVGADCLAYNLNKVFDPTHKLVTAKTCCKMVEDSSGGYLQSGIGSNMFYDFCVKDATPPSCSPTSSADYSSGTALNTTDAVCLRTNATIAGWGCSNFDGRTLKINGNTKNCGDPLPAKAGDGYYYLEVSAGTYPWAGIYWW